MINFRQDYGGYTANGLNKKEKKELEELRNEVKRYRELEQKNQKMEEIREHSDSEESQEDDVDPELNEIQMEKIKRKKKDHRVGVSAEAYGIFNKKENFVPRKIPKTEIQIQRIKSSVINSFLFSNLEAKDLQIVIDAMEEEVFKKGQYVITQGGKGKLDIEVAKKELYSKAIKAEKLKAINTRGR